jgi:hypothetical protein
MIEIVGGILLALVALAVLYGLVVMVCSIFDLARFVLFRQPSIKRRASVRTSP